MHRRSADSQGFGPSSRPSKPTASPHCERLSNKAVAAGAPLRRGCFPGEIAQPPQRRPVFCLPPPQPLSSIALGPIRPGSGFFAAVRVLPRTRLFPERHVFPPLQSGNPAHCRHEHGKGHPVTGITRQSAQRKLFHLARLASIKWAVFARTRRRALANRRSARGRMSAGGTVASITRSSDCPVPAGPKTAACRRRGRTDSSRALVKRRVRRR